MPPSHRNNETITTNLKEKHSFRYQRKNSNDARTTNFVISVATRDIGPKNVELDGKPHPHFRTTLNER